MMKNFFLLWILPAFLACNQSSDSTSNAEKTEIKAQITNLPAGQAFLVSYFADQRFKVDSAMVDNQGKLILKRDQPLPGGMYLLLLPDQQVIQILMDKDQTISLSGDAYDLGTSLIIQGQEDTELLYSTMRGEEIYNNQLAVISQQLSSATPGTEAYEKLVSDRIAATKARKDYLEKIFQQHPNSFFTTFKRSGQNPDPDDVIKSDGTVDLTIYREKFWENVDFNDERLLRTPVIINKLKRQIKDFTIQRADSLISTAKFLMDRVGDNKEYYQFFANWIVLEYPVGESTLMDAEALHVFMVQNYFTEDKAFWATKEQTQAIQQRAFTMAASLIGQTAPDVVSTDPNGNTKSIMEMKSDYIIVYMFNPDCDHCREETPKLVQLMRNQPKQKMQVFAIAIDTDDAKWKNFIRDYGMLDWVNVYDPTNRSIYAKYYVDITPEIYIIDKERKIIAKNLKVFQIEDAIRQYEASKLNELKKLF
jgi:peroxiredoxin